MQRGNIRARERENERKGEVYREIYIQIFVCVSDKFMYAFIKYFKMMCAIATRHERTRRTCLDIWRICAQILYAYIHTSKLNIYIVFHI